MVAETLPNRQYRIRVDGSGRITLRNRRYLRLIKPRRLNTPIPSPCTADESLKTTNKNIYNCPNDGPQSNDNSDASPPLDTVISNKIPRALTRLLAYNSSGNKELTQPSRRIPTRRGGREDGGEI